MCFGELLYNDKYMNVILFGINEHKHTTHTTFSSSHDKKGGKCRGQISVKQKKEFEMKCGGTIKYSVAIFCENFN